MRSRSAWRKPSSMLTALVPPLGLTCAFLDDDGAGEAQGRRRSHHREIVHGAGDGQPPDVAPGEEHGVDHVTVGRDDQPAVAHAQRGAVVHGGDPDAVHREVGEARSQGLLDEHPHGAAAGAVAHRDQRFARAANVGAGRGRGAHKSGCPPYWYQILQVPSLDTMHAPTGLSGTHSLPNSGH